jgi:murein L,D-transpeptidase YcbB/YkuD
VHFFLPRQVKQDPQSGFVRKQFENFDQVLDDDVRQALTRELRTVSVSANGPKGVFPTRQTLSEFYAKRSYRFVWCDEKGSLLPREKTLVETIRRAEDHGLRKEDYGLAPIEGLEARVRKESGDEQADRLADLDVLLTASFLRYASDLSSGRTRPDVVDGEWQSKPPDIDLVAALDRAVERDDVSGVLETLPPPYPGYERLRDALKSLRMTEAQGGWTAVPAGDKLERGARGERVAALRRRLGLPAQDDRYDPSVETAVRAFQSSHGIEPDGKAGARTIAELNVPVESRIRQVELNLERWRWIPRTLGSPCVVVNIPGFELELARAGEPSFRSKIVVGKAFTATPVFSDRIVGVLVNPPWNVPPSIAVGEYLPELRKDPHALERHGLELLQGSADDPRTVDATRVDWDKVDGEHFPYRIRQAPGPENALGKLKFELTNGFHIYLHDTPAGHLFGRSDRGLSHGCIRVEKPVELAQAILGDAKREELQEALDQPEERRIPVRPAIPVHILYWTAWVAEDGGLHFAPDLYDFDRDQMAGLEKRGSLSPTPG